MSDSMDEENLLRQVHPAWIHEGQVSSQVFTPTKKDEGRLSVSRSSKTTPEAAFVHHTKKLGLASAGVVAVTTGECARIDVGWADDPVEGDMPDLAHAYLDMTSLSQGQIRTKAKLLKRLAQEKGFLYFSDE